MTHSFILLESNRPRDQEAAAELWTRACGSSFALSPRTLKYNLSAPLDAIQAGQFAVVNGERVGFVLASILQDHTDVVPREMGWIDALVVAPGFQQGGIGRALLQWAEDWLCEHSRTIARLGGGLRPFAPGVPTALNVNFFRAHGYVPREENYIVQDFGNDLQAYASPLFLRTLNAVCRPAEKTDIDALRTFYAREFPGRWQYEFEQHLHDGARIQDYFILSSERGIDACCQVTLEDSLRPVERYYPSPLPRLWGQVGAIGVSADRRNAGYGSTLLDAALQHLRERGVRGCIIDWTHHIGYYERFGFKPHRAYEVLVKKIRD